MNPGVRGVRLCWIPVFDHNGRGAKGIALRVLSALIFLGVVAQTHAQQTVLEVIDLKYRSADQIVPMLKPLLAPGGTISALQNRVILRTTPQNMAELKKVLDAVDTMPKRLMVSVRQEAVGTGLDTEAEVSGSIGTGDARVSVPGNRSKEGATATVRKGDNVVRGRAISSQSATTDRGVQTVQVLEGNEALIRIGQSVPIGSGSLTVTLLGAQVSQSVEYRDADTGFRVKPRVNGDRVTLEISSRRDTVADPYATAPTFNVQRIDTVVSGRLGEWMDIGGVDQSRVQNEGGTISRRTGSVSDDRKVFVKVDRLP